MIGKTQFRTEIDEQPEVLERLLREGKGTAVAIAERVAVFAPTFMMIAARGSSDNAARYAQYLFGQRHRLPVALAAPSLFGAYGAPPRLGSAWVVGVSQSGQSPDVVRVVAEGRQQGALTLAITNDPRSPLALAAEWVLALGVGEERAVAASKTYLAQLGAFACLSAALEAAQTGSVDAFSALTALPEKVAETLHSCRSLEALSGEFASSPTALVLGRGYNYATGFELALKLKETCHLWAAPYSPADFLHGPAALVGEGQLVLWVAPSSPVLADSTELLKLLEGRGARKMIVSDRPELLARAELPIALPQGVPEWLSPLTAVVPGQCFAEALARARGLNPDRPRGLNKVTLTD